MVKRKILIVDDEENFCDILRLNLESTGKYEVCVENDANNALFAVLHHRPDLVLLDVIMAGKEGPDIAIEIKRDPRLKETPIVFLTATVTQQEVEAEGGRIGGQAFVAKPSSLDVLLDSIERNLVAA
ncbi:MAG TPA: response regulator [Candidatus Omnitrophota bacterium]|nr:response regulator [Candidatus Omnitrophota bacterium]